MPGQLQTLAVPPPVSLDTLVYNTYLAALNGGGGGGGSGNVVGPASSVAGNAAIFADTTGKLLADSGVSLFSAATGFTITGGTTPKTLTVLDTGVAALLNVAQTFSAAKIFSTAGAASTPSVTVNGAVFTGGSSTTTKPLALFEPSGSTSTGWSTSGTVVGVNCPSSFAGNIFDVQFDGRSNFKVGYNEVSIGRYDSFGVGTGNINWSGMYGAAIWQQFGNNAWLFSQPFGATSYLNVSNPDNVGFANLYSDDGSPNTLAIRYVTTPATLRVYNTFTDSSNYERLDCTWSSNVCNLWTSKAGTGTARDLVLGTNATERFRMNATTGAITTTSSITTSAPSGGTAAPWKLGKVTTGTNTISTTDFLEVEISGVLRKLVLYT